MQTCNCTLFVTGTLMMIVVLAECFIFEAGCHEKGSPRVHRASECAWCIINKVNDCERSEQIFNGPVDLWASFALNIHQRARLTLRLPPRVHITCTLCKYNFIIPLPLPNVNENDKPLSTYTNRWIIVALGKFIWTIITLLYSDSEASLATATGGPLLIWWRQGNFQKMRFGCL